VRVQPEPLPAPVPPAEAGPEQAASPIATSAALVAFLEGAGLAHLQVSEEDAEKFLRESGSIVRAAVEGLIGLLLARSELKKEMRAEDRTMVASRDNNPLKLMTDPREAMGYLFDRRERLSGAFLPPVQAVHDACDDLRVHEIALMAGMRAAFQGALKRFEPQLIEREVDKQKGSFSLNKKVKLWDAFVAHHEKLTREAEDDLLKVFGREFLGTYMAQVRRLRGGKQT
jgi:type VI secretion system FHA domain protein